MSWQHRVRIVIALIVNEAKQLLITQRPYHTTLGGYWEFPGGKVEIEEEDAEALTRELREELGIEVKDCQFIADMSDPYTADRSFVIFLVENFKGTASCLEGQLDMRWVNYNELSNYNFPKTNHIIIELASVKSYFL